MDALQRAGRAYPRRGDHPPGKAAQDQKAEGKRLCIDIIQQVRAIKGVSGVHVMAYRAGGVCRRDLHESGVLAGRTPWRRDLIPGPMPHEEIGPGTVSSRAKRCWRDRGPPRPLFRQSDPFADGLAEHKAVVRGTWGAAPVEGLEPDLGDFVVEKMRMSAWEGTRLETILKALHRDTIINTGAWTNMSIEHTARTGADKGYVIITPEDCCATMNAEWHKASIDYAMQNVAEVTKADAVIAALKGR